MELAGLKGLSQAASVSLPNPGNDTQKILSKITVEDNLEAFLYTFEHTVDWDGWCRANLANTLAPLLTGEAQLAYYALLIKDRTDTG
ncbi:olfactory receptor 4D10-like [Tachysurus ichikawai]